MQPMRHCDLELKQLRKEDKKIQREQKFSLCIFWGVVGIHGGSTNGLKLLTGWKKYSATNVTF